MGLRSQLAVTVGKTSSVGIKKLFKGGSSLPGENSIKKSIRIF